MAHLQGQVPIVESRNLVMGMLDLVFVGFSIAIFVVGAAYIAGCQRLQ